MNTGRNIVVPVLVPVGRDTVPRAIVAFAFMMALAVLAMLTVLLLFPGERHDTSTTTGVSTTRLLDPAPSCYPFADCAAPTAVPAVRE
ncbi:hypothetical protein [Nocardia wallacei]|uniref:hypothetical protein n=1 Tax=Nocardia TaxID=1817 RepID=UPI0024588967|nr:hypothetical protein [Nocardia wallacei]